MILKRKCHFLWLGVDGKELMCILRKRQEMHAVNSTKWLQNPAEEICEHIHKLTDSIAAIKLLARWNRSNFDYWKSTYNHAALQPVRLF